MLRCGSGCEINALKLFPSAMTFDALSKTAGATDRPGVKLQHLLAAVASEGVQGLLADLQGLLANKDTRL